MLRLLLVFALIVLPLQIVWSAAAPYCAHETNSAATRHFGHHEHRHQGGDAKLVLDDDSGEEVGVYHADCESCHLGSASALPAPAFTVIESVPDEVEGGQGPAYQSHIPSGLERPDRTERIAAVRFGGVVLSGPNSA